MVFEEYIDWYRKYYWSQERQTVNYPDGCVMTGIQKLYQVSGKKEYLDDILRFGQEYIAEDGTISGFRETEHNLDQIRCGTIALFLYRQTGMAKYWKAAKCLKENLDTFPRTEMGNFWHKEIYPYQVWLDGLYMAMPFYLEYSSMFGETDAFNDAVMQFQNVRTYLFDQKKQLYKHAYDEKKVQPWADPENGRSPSFWGRAVGWYLMALVDSYQWLKQNNQTDSRMLAELLREAAEGLMRYQSSSGLFYQVLDQPDEIGNYLETSASAMISYALMKGSRLSMLPEEFALRGEQIFKAILNFKLIRRQGELHLMDTCASAGLGPGMRRNGSAAYYFSERIEEDNAHGTAACIMAYSEILHHNLSGT